MRSGSRRPGSASMMRRDRGFHTLDKDLDRITHAESAQRHAFRPVWRLGLAMLLLVLGLVLAMGLAGGAGGGGAGFAAQTRTGLAAALIVAGWLGIAIGANDVANSLGPAVGAGAIGLMPGLVLVALAEIAGASLAGGAVSDRLASGILRGAELASGAGPLIMLSALLGAACWITIATGAGLPVSTSHSIVGGIAGAGLAALGPAAVGWGALAIIALSWVAAPLLSGLGAGLLVILVRQKVLNAPDRARAAGRWLPPLVGAMCGLLAAYVVLLADRHLPGLWALPVFAVAALAGAAYTRRMLAAEIAEMALSGAPPRGKRLFRPPLLVAVAIMAFAHGTNDVGNIAGPLSVILASRPQEGLAPIAVPVLLLAGLAIALGTLLFGRRLVVMVGSGITRLNAGRAFCVSLATAATVLGASALGLPVSTTHVAVGGIFGVGFAREWLDRRANTARGALPAEETRRRMLIRRSHVATITAAWLVTVPVTALAGGLCCRLILALTAA